jgi:hypothetical protein
VKANGEEFARLKNDIYCYDALARFFAHKTKAAEYVLNYRHSGDVSQLQEALPRLEKSVECYRELTGLTSESYLYANSMQTRQRRIPVTGADGTNKTWEELLPQYVLELENFRKNIGEMMQDSIAPSARVKELLQPVKVEFTGSKIERIPLRLNERIYSDRDYYIDALAPELGELQFFRFSYEKQLEQGTSITFTAERPVHLLAGYFNGNSYRLLAPPALETNAAANDRGQADIRIANAMTISGLFPVNLYTYTFEPGTHTLNLGKGLVMLLGFIDGSKPVETYDAGIGHGDLHAVDWLFY